MIEAIIRDFLDSQIEAPVYLELPASIPDTYVSIERTGGGKTDHIKRATLAIQSYAPTMYGAAALNEIVKYAMEQAVTLDAVARARLDTDYNFTDQSTKKYRYQAVFDIIYY